jgi:glutamine cyclotransferase
LGTKIQLLKTRKLVTSIVLILVAVCLFFFIPSCDDDKSVDTGGVSPLPRSIGVLIAPKGGVPIKVGDTIPIALTMQDDANQFKKVEFYVDDELVLTDSTARPQFHHFHVPTDGKLGRKSIRAIIYKTNGEKEAKNALPVIVSDIVPAQYTYERKNTYDHDTSAYTQGLVYHNGALYEGTGLKGFSEIKKVDLFTGNTLQRTKVDPSYFGEGITIWNNKIVQITYQSQNGFLYDLNTFEMEKVFRYKNKEGWGLTNDSTHLIMSDGTNVLHFLNPETQEEEKTIEVYSHMGPVAYLNELEYVNGELWANVYTTNVIVKIDPETGKVLGQLDLTNLPVTRYSNTDVLNGIAYNPDSKTFYVTGKRFAELFEIDIITELPK